MLVHPIRVASRKRLQLAAFSTIFIASSSACTVVASKTGFFVSGGLQYSQ
jgi:hypothetical protein